MYKIAISHVRTEKVLSEWVQFNFETSLLVVEGREDTNTTKSGSARETPLAGQ